jgi:hypothetical protein
MPATTFVRRLGAAGRAARVITRGRGRDRLAVRDNGVRSTRCALRETATVFSRLTWRQLS